MLCVGKTPLLFLKVKERLPSVQQPKNCYAHRARAHLLHQSLCGGFPRTKLIRLAQLKELGVGSGDFSLDYKPTYLFEDLLRIAGGFPLHILRSRHSLIPELDHLAAMLPAVVDDWDAFVMQEDLAAALPLCRFAKIMTPEIRNDLAFSTGHLASEGLAAILSLLFPQQDDADFVAKVFASRTTPVWMMDVLHAKTIKTLAPEDVALCEKLAKLGSMVAQMSCPVPMVWKLTDIPLDAFQDFQVEFKTRYKTDGQDAALQFLEDMRTIGPEELALYLKHRFPR